MDTGSVQYLLGTKQTRIRQNSRLMISQVSANFRQNTLKEGIGPLMHSAARSLPLLYFIVAVHSPPQHSEFPPALSPGASRLYHSSCGVTAFAVLPGYKTCFSVQARKSVLISGQAVNSNILSENAPMMKSFIHFLYQVRDRVFRAFYERDLVFCKRLFGVDYFITGKTCKVDQRKIQDRIRRRMS